MNTVEDLRAKMKLAKVLKRYDDHFCYDKYQETIRDNKYPNPYTIEQCETLMFNDEGDLID